MATHQEFRRWHSAARKASNHNHAVDVRNFCGYSIGGTPVEVPTFHGIKYNSYAMRALAHCNDPLVVARDSRRRYAAAVCFRFGNYERAYALYPHINGHSSLIKRAPQMVKENWISYTLAESIVRNRASLPVPQHKAWDAMMSRMFGVAA